MKLFVLTMLVMTASWLPATTVTVGEGIGEKETTFGASVTPAPFEVSDLLPPQKPTVAPPVTVPGEAKSATPVPETTGVVVFAFLGVLFMLRRRSV